MDVRVPNRLIRMERQVVDASRSCLSDRFAGMDW